MLILLEAFVENKCYKVSKVSESMGKMKSCTQELRKTIVEMYRDGYSYGRISEIIKCSKKMCFNAVKHFQLHGTTDNVPRRQRHRKTSPQIDRRIVRLAKMDPHKTAVDIWREIFGESSSRISIRTVRNRLKDANLFGRIPRKTPLTNDGHRRKRIAFAEKYRLWSVREWKNVLFSDETKINRFGSDGKRYVRRPPCKAFEPKYTKQTIKFGGGSIMVWACFSWTGVGPIYRINGIMDQHQYRHILEDVMEPYADDNLCVLWKFQHDNDPKHTARSVKDFLRPKNIDGLAWPSSSPDLNPIENLWADIISRVG